MSAQSALGAYRDDGPLAAGISRVAGGRLRIDPALLTVAGIVPVAVVAALPGGGSRLALGAGVGWLILCVGASAGLPLSSRMSWLIPPLLRATEYALLLRLAVLADGALGLCYAFLAVVTFHHYDVVYRIRARGAAPPAWLRLAGGGWDLRLLVAYCLFAAGGLAIGLAAGAVLLGGLFVAESVRSWLPGSGQHLQQTRTRNGRPEQSALYQDDEADDE